MAPREMDPSSARYEAEHYLDVWKKGWMEPLPEKVLKDLSQEDREKFREIEGLLLKAEFQTLADIVLNCTNKYQFAKTYKVLRRSWEKTKAEMSSASSEQMPPEIKPIMLDLCGRMMSQKWSNMDDWFSVRWGEDIRDYTQPAPGCSGVVLTLCLGLLAILLFL